MKTTVAIWRIVLWKSRNSSGIEYTSTALVCMGVDASGDPPAGSETPMGIGTSIFLLALGAIEAIALSHGHWDHAGGLVEAVRHHNGLSARVKVRTLPEILARAVVSYNDLPAAGTPGAPAAAAPGAAPAAGTTAATRPTTATPAPAAPAG